MFRSDMLARERDKTTLLPQTLRERIEKQGLSQFFDPPGLCQPIEVDRPSRVPNVITHSHNSYLKPSKKGKTRKATREEERAAKKQRKAEYFAQRPRFKEESKSLKRKADLESNERPVKRQKMEDGVGLMRKISGQRTQKEFTIPASPKQKRKEMEASSFTPTKATTAQKAKATVATKSTKRHTKIPGIPALESDEDREIAWLEYQLGIESGKKTGRGSTTYSKLLKEDGLDGNY
jgi:hypothetical protein